MLFNISGALAQFYGYGTLKFKQSFKTLILDLNYLIILEMCRVNKISKKQPWGPRGLKQQFPHIQVVNHLVQTQVQTLLGALIAAIPCRGVLPSSTTKHFKHGSETLEIHGENTYLNTAREIILNNPPSETPM